MRLATESSNFMKRCREESMNDLKNNQVRMLITTTVVGDSFEDTHIVTECGEDVGNNKKIVKYALPLIIALRQLKDSGVTLEVMKEIISYALMDTYGINCLLEEDTEA